MTGTLLVDLLLFLYAVVAPGVCAAWLFLGERDPLVLAILGTVIGLFVMPVVTFVLAMAFRTHITPLLVLGTATVALAAMTYRLLRVRRAAG